MRIAHQTYYEEAIGAAYPFDASATRSNGRVDIDDDIFADGRLYPPNGRCDLFIESIVVASKIIIYLANGRGAVGSGSFDRNAPPNRVSFTVAGGIHLGVLVAHPEGLSKIAGWPNGTYAFLASQTRFAATVVTPQPQVCVRTVRLESGAIFHGDVTLVGEKGVQLTLEGRDASSSSGGDFNGWIDWESIRVDVVGDPLFVRRGCDDEGIETERDRIFKRLVYEGTPIAPGENGGVHITAGPGSGGASEPALRVVPIQNGIKVFFIGRSP